MMLFAYIMVFVMASIASGVDSLILKRRTRARTHTEKENTQRVKRTRSPISHVQDQSEMASLFDVGQVTNR